MTEPTEIEVTDEMSAAMDRAFNYTPGQVLTAIHAAYRAGAALDPTRTCQEAAVATLKFLNFRYEEGGLWTPYSWPDHADTDPTPTDADVESLAVTLYGAYFNISDPEVARRYLENDLKNNHSRPIIWLRIARATLAHAACLPSIAAARQDAEARIRELDAEINNLKRTIELQHKISDRLIASFKHVQAERDLARSLSVEMAQERNKLAAELATARARLTHDDGTPIVIRDDPGLTLALPEIGSRWGRRGQWQYHVRAIIQATPEPLIAASEMWHDSISVFFLLSQWDALLLDGVEHIPEPS